jgi:hypothetical protein
MSLELVTPGEETPVVVEKTGKDWPPKPDFGPASWAEQQKMFGSFDWVAAPTKINPEAITIKGSWVQNNISQITIPQLFGIVGAPGGGKISWHNAGVRQIIGLFQAWDDAGLSHLIKTWGGSWCPRLSRGSKTCLSNHAYGTAFDINVAWNYLNQTPALVGHTGSVRELVPLALEWGFFWGGFGLSSNPTSKRVDGMHFQLYKLIVV